MASGMVLRQGARISIGGREGTVANVTSNGLIALVRLDHGGMETIMLRDAPAKSLRMDRRREIRESYKAALRARR